MESYYLNNFEVKPKHSSEEALQKWRKLCGFVKNPKRRFRFTANLSKRYEAQAMRRTNQVHPCLSLFFYDSFISFNQYKKEKKKKFHNIKLKAYRNRYTSHITKEIHFRVENERKTHSSS